MGAFFCLVRSWFVRKPARKAAGSIGAVGRYPGSGQGWRANQRPALGLGEAIRWR